MMYQCCLCGFSIQGEQPPVVVTVGLEDADATQGLYCHGACLVNALHPSVPAAFAGAGTIFMPLLDEGTPVWRPVEARKVGKDSYQIANSVQVPDDEKWLYQPGSTVRCELKTFRDGDVVLVAVDEA